ncbi:spore germination protein [Bacillus sp. EB600]|uniref:spore germination protein n=1 Tax=Bacillus sp. EB600 TaxID=2806345 RepID=UPI00210A3F65|nr:spore germination protein [Bacillus sp. EB600]
MSILSRLNKKQKAKQNDNFRQNQDPNEPSKLLILPKYKDNLNRIQSELGNSGDVALREFHLGPVKGIVIYIDGLANNTMISDFFLEIVVKEEDKTHENVFQYMVEKATGMGNLEVIKDWNAVYDSLLSGNTLIFMDGFVEAISVETKGWEKRAISEPTTQLAIRGPKDSFTESLRTNTALIRRRIKSPNLWLESMKIGKVTQTDVGIMYIKGIAEDKIVDEVKTRLKRIDMDGILESGFIEQCIEDQTLTTFPTTFSSERPDVVTSQILEGRVAIIVDGTPFVITTPTVFIQFFQSPDDYYFRYDITSGLRLLRILSFFTSLVGPALYIAATTFHQEMMPTPMAIAIAAQRENVPFPAFVEALIMEVTFEILREAGIRLPRAVGQAVSIVGALVIGQAAVQAGVVSPVMVIVVSMTAIANFATPSFAMAISSRLIRFFLMGLATFLGFFGITLGLLVMFIHLCSLRSFGVPYMSPLAPFNLKYQQDTIFRFPIYMIKERPPLMTEGNVTRAGNNQKPGPPK